MTDEPAPAKGADLVREAMAKARTDARERAAKTAGGTRRTSRNAAKEALRSGRDGGDPVPFGAALNDLLAARGWQAQAAGASVLSRWDSLVGEQIAAHSRPVQLRDGQLVIEAESTAWATQLRLLSRTLTAKLTEQLGADVVRSITVKGPSGRIGGTALFGSRAVVARETHTAERTAGRDPTGGSR